MLRSACVAAIALVSACRARAPQITARSRAEPAVAQSTQRAAPTASACDAPPELLESREIERWEGNVARRVVYRSCGLRVLGLFCHPDDRARHPVLLVNHGGFRGMPGEWGFGSEARPTWCRRMARLRVAVAMSQYRGERDEQGESEGRVEVCAGEVSDAMNLLALARREPFADGARVAMWGASHGGCITLSALARGADVVAAVDLFGITDMRAQYAFSAREARGEVPGRREIGAWLRDQLESSLGGEPGRAHEAYVARSPASRAAQIARVPLLVQHGTEDDVVPLAQSCELARALRSAGRRVTFSRVSSTGAVSTEALPGECDGASPSGDGAPGDDVHVQVIDAMGHQLAQATEPVVIQTVALFLAPRLLAPAR